MSRIIPAVGKAAKVLVVSAWLVSQPAVAQHGEIEPPFADTGEIDGDLAGRPPPQSHQPKYAPGVWEAYEEQMATYRQKLAEAETEKRTRAQATRRQQEIYRRDLAEYHAARRRYQAERAAYEAKVAGLRQ